MMLVRFLVLASIFCLAFSASFHRKVTKGKGANATHFTLNLDAAPCQRWNDIAKQAHPKFIADGIRSLFEFIFPTPEMFHMAEVIASKLDRYFQEPYSDEMRCLSQVSGVPLGDVILANVFYELATHAHSNKTACTSIVAVDKDQKIIHGRNLDLHPQAFLKNSTIVVDYQRNGKTVFTGVTFIGYLGIVTGVRHGAFSLSGNQRNYGSLYTNLLAMLSGAQLTFFTARRVLDESSDYVSALNQLTNTPTAAPVYFILGGITPLEGALVVRNGMDAAVVKKLSDFQQHNWFIVETNYDPWLNPPKSDDRRDVAIKAMEKIGKSKMDADQLYKVMSTPPIFNSATIYTTIMSASNSTLFSTTIRYDAPSDY